jgi:acetolactate decarboxylase
MSKEKATFTAVAILAALAMIPCAEAAGNDTIFQVSTIDALLQGVFDGFFPFEELMKHGDFGIGTFDSLDGEMIAVDGQYYQVKADGTATPIDTDMKTPFSTVTYFETDKTAAVHRTKNMSEFASQLDLQLPSKNVFYALRIDGSFPYVKTRSIPKQEKPYPRLADAVTSQSIREFRNASGTIVGFWTPEFFEGLNVPGYHVHFLTDDKKQGGHVLDFETNDAVVKVDITSGMSMELPKDGDFYNVDLTGDLQAELKKVES